MSVAASGHIQLTDYYLLDILVNYCQASGYNLAVWRPPQSDIKILIDTTDNSMEDVPLEEKPSGFIFSPFDKNKKQVYLKADFFFSLKELKNDPLKLETLDPLLPKRLKRIPQPYQHNHYDVIASPSDKSYISLVDAAIANIKGGMFQKVVPSRTKTIIFENDFKAGKNFIALCASYPLSFISMVYAPETNLWLGATPELLLSSSGNIFKTVALAGTQKLPADGDIQNAAWRQKEIEEQAYVCRYIINCFKKIQLREFDEKGPKTAVAGNLMHLKTEYSADMQATGFENLASLMLELLHPTSAVCGMPLEPALKFLKEKEDHDRSFFSGYLGPVNIEEKTTLYVNLRCMKVIDKKAILYAGAGVTEDSDPYMEWEETELKMNTLLNVIK